MSVLGAGIQSDSKKSIPDSKVHGDNMASIWGPRNIDIWGDI